MSYKHKLRSDAAQFISDPTVLTFSDFEIGETMELPFKLTNVSIISNAYQFKGFDKECASLFELDFTPPGHLPPGMSSSLVLRFTPKFDTEVCCKIHFLAEGGPFTIPIECYPKKVNIQIEPIDELNIGSITLGEEGESRVVIRNSGALDASWTTTFESEGDNPGDFTIQEVMDNVIQLSSRQGVVKGYSSSKTHVIFAPPRPAHLSFIIRFHFTSDTKRFEPFYRDLKVTGVALDVPVFLERTELDFGVCFFDELYRATLVAHNRSSLTQNFVIENSQSFVEFIPKKGFIQPQSSLKIPLKLRVGSEFEGTTDKVSINFRMRIVDQVLPVNFSVSFIPSSAFLTFNPPSLDFGSFLSTESSTIVLKIHNTQVIPVDFGFVKLPHGITVTPNDGFGMILPDEDVDVSITFQTDMVKKHNFSLRVVTLQGAQFKLNGTANVMGSPIEFESSTINFEATPLGETSKAYLVVSNKKDYPVDIEFEKQSNFCFDPIFKTLQPNETTAVFLKFTPEVPIMVMEKAPDAEQASDKKRNKKHTRSHKQSAEQEKPADKTQIIDPNFTYRLYEANVACFYNAKEKTGRHHVALRAAAILPSLFVTSVQILQKERKNEEYIDLALKTIDAGVIAVGQFVDVLVTIKSASKHRLHLDYFVESGVFEVLSATGIVSMAQPYVLKVRFAPTLHRIFQSNITVYSTEKPNIRTTLNFRGEGAAPSITLSNDTIEFGHVVVGHPIVRSIQVGNNADFPLEYIYTIKPEPNCINSDGSDVFTLPKASERLGGGQNGEALVRFCVDHDEADFNATLIVSAGEDGLSREVSLHATSWPHPMFIIGGVESPRYKTAFDHFLLDEPYFRPSVTVNLAWPGSSAQATLTVGVANQAEEGKKMNGDFQIDNFQTPGFTITPVKSAIEAGGKIQVNIEYAPPASSLLQVGQWVVLESNINLKCGDFVRKVPFKVKCLINLQQAADLSLLSTQRTSKGGGKRGKKK